MDGKRWRHGGWFGRVKKYKSKVRRRQNFSWKVPTGEDGGLKEGKLLLTHTN